MTISNEQRDVLTELVNIGVGHAASTLNSFIGHKIRLVVPEIMITSPDEIARLPEFSSDGEVSSVSMPFHGGFNGNASLVFPMHAAAMLVSILTDEAPDSPEIDEFRSGTLAEIGNILLNGVMGSIGNMMETKMSYSVPAYAESTVDGLIGKHAAEALLLARAQFFVDELRIEGSILLFFEIDSYHSLIDSVDEALAA